MSDEIAMKDPGARYGVFIELVVCYPEQQLWLERVRRRHGPRVRSAMEHGPGGP